MPAFGSNRSVMSWVRTAGGGGAIGCAEDWVIAAPKPCTCWNRLVASPAMPGAPAAGAVPAAKEASPMRVSLSLPSGVVDQTWTGTAPAWAAGTFKLTTDPTASVIASAAASAAFRGRLRVAMSHLTGRGRGGDLPGGGRPQLVPDKASMGIYLAP